MILVGENVKEIDIGKFSLVGPCQVAQDMDTRRLPKLDNGIPHAEVTCPGSVQYN